MRPVLAILVWVVILGGLYGYMRFRDRLAPRPEEVFRVSPAPGNFSVELTPTFDAQGGVDPFALDPVAKPAIVLWLNGTEIVRYEQTARAGIPVEFTWDTDEVPLELEKNEFRIQVRTPGDNPNAVRGVRLRLLRDGAEVASETLWSEPGQPVDGVVRINIEGAELETEDPADHA